MSFACTSPAFSGASPARNASRLSKAIRSFLNPAVLALARLLEMTSSRCIAARLPESAAYNPLFIKASFVGFWVEGKASPRVPLSVVLHLGAQTQDCLAVEL